MNAATPVAGELIPMRPDEQIDPERVGAFLAGKLPGAGGTPEILQFEGGKANLTYLLRYPGREYVLRRPPLGPVAPKAHDMGREYRVLSVLYRKYPLAPRAYLFSEDASLVGAPFLIMERRRGIVIRDAMPSRYLGQPEMYRRLSEAMVDALVELHAVQPAAVGLETLGRPEGFMARQVEGWYRRYLGARTDDDPLLDELMPWLRSNIPPQRTVSLVHNDYKLNNMLVREEDPAQLVAVLDWDMCTLGDPLADLGWLLSVWVGSDASQDAAALRVIPPQLPDCYSQKQVVARYAERSGWDLEQVGYYEVFNLFKRAVVLQQIYARWHHGQTRDARFREMGRAGKGLLRAALDKTGPRRPAG